MGSTASGPWSPGGTSAARRARGPLDGPVNDGVAPSDRTAALATATVVVRRGPAMAAEPADATAAPALALYDEQEEGNFNDYAVPVHFAPEVERAIDEVRRIDARTHGPARPAR